MTAVPFRRLALLFAAVTLIFGRPHSALADTMPPSVTSLGFSTSGQIGAQGVTGFNALSFRSQSDPVWGTTGSRYLGQFLTAPLPPGLSTTYQDTPFSISILPLGLNYDGKWYTDDLQPVVLKGRLNGTLTGGGYSSLVASFDPVDPWVDIVKGGVSGMDTFLTGVGPFLIGGQGTTSAMMNWTLIAGAPVPEPSTMLVLSAGMTLAWAARRRGWI